MALLEDKQAEHFLPNISDISKIGLDSSMNMSHHAMNNTAKEPISALNESMAWNLMTVMDDIMTAEDLPAVVDEMMAFGMNNATMSDLMPIINPTVASMSKLVYVRMISTIMMTVTFALVNLAMGAAIGKVELTRQFRVPSGVLVGSITQFLLFPLLAFVIALFFRLPWPYVTGMLLVAICPGGAMANVVTFFIDGNICVCTSMVLISTVVSMGYVPIMLLIISGGTVSAPVVVSMWAIGVAIFIIAVPLAIGVAIRAYKESWAQVVTMIGITGGLLAFTANSLIHLIIHTHVFHAPARVYIATMLVVICGFLVAMFVAFLCGQHPTSRHTLATNAVFHNTSLTMIVLCTIFSNDPNWHQLIVIPSIYGPITGIFGIIYIIVYLTVVVSREESPSSHHSASYLPINEEPRGNRDYMALEGNDDDMNDVKLNMGIQNGLRLKLTDYEVVRGTVSPMPAPVY